MFSKEFLFSPLKVGLVCCGGRYCQIMSHLPLLIDTDLISAEISHRPVMLTPNVSMWHKVFLTQLDLEDGIRQHLLLQ